MTQIFLAFIPLFVAIDALGVLPLFLSLSKGLSTTERHRLINQATLTAFGIAVIFVAAGKMIFDFLGITESDFRIAGGLVLLILAIQDLLFSDVEKNRSVAGDIGIVPIGIPLIMGPAALTTIIISNDTYGIVVTLVAVVMNLVIVWLLFRHSPIILKFIGEGGAKAFAKVASLFLAAIAIMMIRVGILEILETVLKN